ncbi:hypothetical protein [Orientia tsutsugamushi]|uniref:Uncharacterized protein n=1 Tax=Orientia tsutsugamushi TaxID=784 RepID=A0A2U3R0I1_ORITS|nr:hypothetical protein [Orientia tsutsugamushi]KJV55965.1 hypothetical protein OTSKATO_0481 [Orientia tsutsugamushi str. Kato PP]SPR06689.1 Uncharacterised protein [Orientia tsutsugamushi]
MITKQISQKRYFGKLITKQAMKVESQENLQTATLLSKMDVCIEKVDQELFRAEQIIKKQDIRLQKLKLIHKTLDNLEYNYQQKILKSYGMQGLDSNKKDLLMIDDSKLLNNHVKDELSKLINVKGKKIEWQKTWQTLLSKIDACIEKIDQELSNAEQIIKEQDIRLHQLKSIHKALDNLEHNYKQKIYLKDANAFISEQKENYFVHLILKKLETHRSTLDTALQILTSNKLSSENRDIKIRDLLDTTYKAENVNNLEVILCDTFNIIHKVKKLIDNTSKTKDGDAILAQHVLEIFEKIVANLQSNQIILDYAKQNLGKSYLKLFSEDKKVDLNCSLESTKAQNTEDVPILNSKTEKLVNKNEEIADNEIIHKNSSAYLQIYNSDLKEIKSIMRDIKEIAETEYSNDEYNNAIKRAAIEQIDTCISKCDTICNPEKENQNSDGEITLEEWKKMTECTKENSKTEQNNLNEHTTFFDKAKEAVVTVASSFFKLFLPIAVNNKNSVHETQDLDISSSFELLDINENDTEAIGEVL